MRSEFRISLPKRVVGAPRRKSDSCLAQQPEGEGFLDLGSASPEPQAVLPNELAGEVQPAVAPVDTDSAVGEQQLDNGLPAAASKSPVQELLADPLFGLLDIFDTQRSPTEHHSQSLAEASGNAEDLSAVDVRCRSPEWRACSPMHQDCSPASEYKPRFVFRAAGGRREMKQRSTAGRMAHARQRAPSELALHTLLRVIADAEADLEEKRKRLLLTPKRAFLLLHRGLEGSSSAAISADNLRTWLSGLGVTANQHGQDVEAFIARYSGGDAVLDLNSMIRIVTPRCSAETKAPPLSGPPVFSTHSAQCGSAGHAFGRQKALRLAQLIARELQLIRIVIRRQQQLVGFHKLHPSSAIMLFGAACVVQGGISLANLQDHFGYDAPSLTDEQQRLLLRHIGLCAHEKVCVEEWDAFMRLGDHFALTTPE